MKSIKKVEIANIRGIRSMVIELGAITVLRGANGSGKSSIVEALRQTFAGGYDPLAVSTWSDFGSITLTADDGTIITRTINRAKKTSTLDIKSAAGEKIPAPQSFIDRMTQAFAYDPLALLRASKAERFKHLRETLAVEVDAGEILEISRKYFTPDEAVLDSWDAKLSGLDRIARVRKAIYDRRSAINKKSRDLEGALRTMKESVPSLNAEGQDWSGSERRLAEELSAAQSAKSAAMQQATDEAASAQKEINDWEKAEIARIRAEAAGKREAIGKALGEAILQVAREHDGGISDLSQRHSAARQQLADYNRAVGARDAIAKLEKEIEDSRTLGDKYTFVIEGIDDLEKRKLAASPAPGVTLSDGEIYIDGVPFDGVNTQRRYQAAIQIAAANSGDFKFLLVDEAEHWDTKNFDDLVEAAKSAGFQVVAATVDDCPLAVEAA